VEPNDKLIGHLGEGGEALDGDTQEHHQDRSNPVPVHQRAQKATSNVIQMAKSTIQPGILPNADPTARIRSTSTSTTSKLISSPPCVRRSCSAPSGPVCRPSHGWCPFAPLPPASTARSRPALPTVWS